MKVRLRKRIIIFILGGFAKKDSAGVWHTADQYEGYNQFGINGHRIRILAGYYLYKQYPQAIIITSGGKGKLRRYPDMPPVSSIMKKELVELGVPRRSIQEESRSGNTYEQLVAIAKVKERENPSSILILTNTYHLPRVKAFLTYRSELKRVFRQMKYRLLSADAVVSRHNARIKQLIKNTYTSPEMKVHIALEQKGIKALKAGKYKF